MEKEKKSRKKRLLSLMQKYVTIFIGAVITAVGLEIFLIPNNIIDGGVVGLTAGGAAAFLNSEYDKDVVNRGGDG